MPYLVTTAVYPSHKVSEVTERYIQALQKFPHDESLSTQLVPSAVKATPNGIRNIIVEEVKSGKLEEAYNRAVNMAVMFHSIEGFEYTIEVNLKVEEALSMINVSLPK
jgi:hypothetical protein